MIKNTIKKKLSILLIISMIFTSSGVNTFANVEAGSQAHPYEGVESGSHPQEGSFGETHPYEDVGADIIRPSDDVNEETENLATENLEELEDDKTNNETVASEDIEEPENETESEVKEETKIFDSENIEEETEKETIEIESKEIKISTDSEIEEEIKNEDEDEVVEVDTEELETVSKEIYGATPTNRSVTFTLPKDLVEEGIFSFGGGNGTISEDGCSLTQDFGMAMGNSSRYVNAPQVVFNNCPNQGITFNRQWWRWKNN